jgi:putative transcriptional regulator
MTPNHHPYPETLVSYAAGTLVNAAACVVACHLSLCADCAAQVRWLERLAGVMLSNLETDDPDMAMAERAVSRLSIAAWPDAPAAEQVPEISDPLLPSPLARLGVVHGAAMSLIPPGNGGEESITRLPERYGAMKLLRLSPGQPLPAYVTTMETEVALVLQGACRDEAGIYFRGDVIERAEDALYPPTAFGEVDCICLVTDQALA